MKERIERLNISGLSVEVIRKRVKNFNVRIYPPDGHISVSVPCSMDDKTIRKMIKQKMLWIRKKQRMVQSREIWYPPEMIPGEIHTFQGKPYSLNIYEHSGPPCVSIHNDSILEMYVRPGSDRKKRINILEEWYRLQLKEQIPHLISRWESVMGVSVKEWGVKKMKTRWGSCNIKSQRIWLNLELAKRPQQCLEYIVVHEMIHLLERYHNTRFYRLMDAYMPEWRDYFYILNKTSLLNTMRLY